MFLEDDDNLYQQLLSREAKLAAERLGIVVLEPEFAESSSWTQIEAVNAHLRKDPPPDALMIVLAGEQSSRPTFERVVDRGVALAFLNRIPAWVPELREQHPRALAVGITPRQVGIGELQGCQALALARPGTSVLLVTGSAGSVTAIERTRGFRETVKDRLTVHAIDGRWSGSRARSALREWFRRGSPDESLGLVVCQNDAMAAGVRSGLNRAGGRPGPAGAPGPPDDRVRRPGGRGAGHGGPWRPDRHRRSAPHHSRRPRDA